MEEVVPTEKAWGKLLQDLGSSSLTGKRAWLSSIIYSIYFQVYLSTYCVQGNVLNAEDSMLKVTGRVPAFSELIT